MIPNPHLALWPATNKWKGGWADVVSWLDKVLPDAYADSAYLEDNTPHTITIRIEDPNTGDSLEDIYIGLLPLLTQNTGEFPRSQVFQQVAKRLLDYVDSLEHTAASLFQFQLELEVTKADEANEEVPWPEAPQGRATFHQGVAPTQNSASGDFDYSFGEDDGQSPFASPNFLDDLGEEDEDEDEEEEDDDSGEEEDFFEDDDEPEIPDPVDPKPKDPVNVGREPVLNLIIRSMADQGHIGLSEARELVEMERMDKSNILMDQLLTGQATPMTGILFALDHIKGVNRELINTQRINMESNRLLLSQMQEAQAEASTQYQQTIQASTRNSREEAARLQNLLSDERRNSYRSMVEAYRNQLDTAKEIGGMQLQHTREISQQQLSYQQNELAQRKAMAEALQADIKQKEKDLYLLKQQSAAQTSDNPLNTILGMLPMAVQGYQQGQASAATAAAQQTAPAPAPAAPPMNLPPGGFDVGMMATVLKNLPPSQVATAIGAVGPDLVGNMDSETKEYLRALLSEDE